LNFFLKNKNKKDLSIILGLSANHVLPWMGLRVDHCT